MKRAGSSNLNNQGHKVGSGSLNSKGDDQSRSPMGNEEVRNSLREDFSHRPIK